MRGKAKLLLILFKVLIFALILFPYFNDGASNYYKFDKDKGFKEWRIYQLKNIAEIDNSTGKPLGSKPLIKGIQLEEFEYLKEKEQEEYKKLFETFNQAFEDLANKVVELLFPYLKFFREEKFFKEKRFSKEKIAEVLKEYDEIVKNSQGNEETIAMEIDKEKVEASVCSTSPYTEECYELLIKLVIDCKIFIIDSEGFIIDIYSFMEKSPSSLKNPKEFLRNITALHNLKLIFDLSKIQSKKLDNAIFEKIYKEHKQNIQISPEIASRKRKRGEKPATWSIQNKTKKENKNAIVEGIGTIGLYAAYKLFMEGINVTIVNNHSNTSNQQVFFDRKWMSQLRFFLGTEYDKLFDKEGKSKGRLLDEDISLVNINNIETSLKNRLKSLSSYVNEKEEIRVKNNEINKKEKSFLKLFYNKTILKIDTKEEKPMVFLGKMQKKKVKKILKKNKRNLKKVSTEKKVIIEQKETNPQKRQATFLSNLSDKMKSFNPFSYFKEDKLENITPERIEELKREGEALEFKNLDEEMNDLNEEAIETGEKEAETSNEKEGNKIPFDLLFFSVGEGKICDKYLEKPKQLTESKNYFSFTLNKKYHNTKVFENNKIFFREMMLKKAQYIRDQKLEDFIKQAAFLSEEIRKRYSDISGNILNGMNEHGDRNEEPRTRKGKVYMLFNRKSIMTGFIHADIIVSIYETKKFLKIETETPMIIAEFIEELKLEKNEKVREFMKEELEIYKKIKDKNSKAWSKFAKMKDEHEEELGKYDDFHAELLKKWAKTVFYYVYSIYYPKMEKQILFKEKGEEDFKEKEETTPSTINDKNKKVEEPPKQILYFDNINTKTFWAEIKGIENPVKEIKGTKDSAIIAAIGDANTNVPFMTDSELRSSAGRFVVDNAISIIKLYNQSGEKQHLEKMLKTELRKMRKEVLEKEKEEDSLKVLPGVKIDLNKEDELN